jgi:hypothetical protein
MKKILLICLSLLFVLTSNSQNLIKNSSFDSLGHSSGKYWYDLCNKEITYLDTNNQFYCTVEFVKNSTPVSAFGDTTSLWVLVGPPGAYWGVRTFVTGQTGTKIYQLQYWMKSLPKTGGSSSSGGAIIGTWSNNQYVSSKLHSDTVSVWTQYTIIDTLTTNFNDSICVTLFSPGPDFQSNNDLFDNIELTVIDSITSTGIKENSIQNMKIFPVPSQDKVVIETPFFNTGDWDLHVYNSIGYLIKTIDITKEATVLQGQEFSKGVYYIEISNKLIPSLAKRRKIIFE